MRDIRQVAIIVQEMLQSYAIAGVNEDFTYVKRFKWIIYFDRSGTRA